MNPDLVSLYYKVANSPPPIQAKAGPTGQCTCNRQPEQILCKFCKTTFRGRQRMACGVHPNTIHLMDYASCPSCKREL